MSCWKRCHVCESSPVERGHVSPSAQHRDGCAVRAGPEVGGAVCERGVNQRAAKGTGWVVLAEVFGEGKETLLVVVLAWADSTAWLVGSVPVGRGVCSCIRLRATAFGRCLEVT